MLKKAFFIFIVLSPLWPTYVGIKFADLPILNISRFFSVMVLFLLVTHSFLLPGWLGKQTKKLKKAPLSSVIGIYFAWRLISAATSTRPGYSFFIVAVDLLLQYQFYLIAALFINTKNDFFAAIRYFTFAGAIVVSFSLIEAQTQRNFFAAFAPASSSADYINAAVSEKIRDGYRIQAGFLHPLVLANYLVLIVPLSIGVFINKAYGSVTRYIALYASIGGILATVYTGSRSGILILGLEFIIGIFLMAVSMKKNAWGVFKMMNLSIIAIVAGILGFGAGGKLVEGRSSAESMSSMARVDQLNASLAVLQTSPILGVGPGLAASYAYTENADGVRSLDSFFLTVLVESGVIGLLLFLALLVCAFTRTMKLLPVGDIINRSSLQAISISIVGATAFCSILSIYEIFPYLFSFFGLISAYQRISVSNIVNKNFT